VLRRLSHGLRVLDVEERERLLRLAHRRRRELVELERRIASLSAREEQVLGELMHGRPVHDIAARCSVAEATVRTQVKSILSKLGVSSQLAAVGVAHRVSWRPPPHAALVADTPRDDRTREDRQPARV
jgi:DNA-binding NarL/FixJ family response regulator